MTDTLLLFISDTHGGDSTGLTPFPWHKQIEKIKAELKSSIKVNQLYMERKINEELCRREKWKLWSNQIKKLKATGLKIVLICVGDLIQGRAPWNKGVELIEPDMKSQCRMANFVVNYIGADEVLFVTGTPVHSGKDYDYEQEVFTDVNNLVGGDDHLFLDVNGYTFDIKHDMGGGSTKQAVNNALTKQQESAHDWYVRSLLKQRQLSREAGKHVDYAPVVPLCDYTIRAHGHTYSYMENEMGICIALPGQQALGGASAKKKYIKRVSWGIAWLIVPKKGKPQPDSYTIFCDHEKANVYEIK